MANVSLSIYYACMWHMRIQLENGNLQSSDLVCRFQIAWLIIWISKSSGQSESHHTPHRALWNLQFLAVQLLQNKPRVFRLFHQVLRMSLELKRCKINWNWLRVLVEITSEINITFCLHHRVWWWQCVCNVAEQKTRAKKSRGCLDWQWFQAVTSSPSALTLACHYEALTTALDS